MDTKFEQYILSLRNQELNETLELLPIKTARIIDIIFFPYFKHAPMVRIDGEGMNKLKIRQCELSSKKILIRDQNLAHLISPDKLHKLQQHATKNIPGVRTEWEPADELYKQSRVFLKKSRCSEKKYVIWEIDVENDDSITVRLVKKNKTPDKTDKDVKIGNISIEIIKELDIKDCENLLRAFDEAKNDKKPFFAYLLKLLQENK